MGASVRPDDLDSLIAARQAALGHAPAAQPGHDDIDALIASRQAALAPPPAAPRSTLYNAVNTVDNALTAGLGQKFNAAYNAVGDVVRGRDSFTHSFNKNLDAENAGLAAFRANHPIGSAVASGIGGGAQAVLAAPLAAAGEVGTGLSLAQRTAAAARTGGALTAVGALGNAQNNGGLLLNAGRALGAGVVGAGLGAAAVPASEAVGRLAGRLGSATDALTNRVVGSDDAATPLATRLTPRAATIAGSQSASQPALPSRSSQLLLRSMQRAGITPQDALDRLTQVPTGKPVTVMEIAGDMSHPIRQLGKFVARTPSAGAAELRAAIEARKEPLTNAQRVLGDVSEAMGQPRQNLVAYEQALGGKQLANAKPHYDAAFGDNMAPVPLTTRVDEESPTLGELLNRPSLKSALNFHNTIAAEKGEGPLSLPVGEPTLPAPPPGFTPAQWEETLRGARARGVSTSQVTPAPQSAPEVPLRDANGRLRRDLSKVADEHLQAEWLRLAEMNGEEEGLHTGVETQGYREDYHALPRTEKLGVRGREDLPDADGTVDPERLLEDNKIVRQYNRNSVVRAARQKAMDRISAEMTRRESPDDFSFGANAPTQPTQAVQSTPPVSSVPSGPSVQLKSLQQLKFKLDDMLGFAKRNGTLPDGTPATNARLGAINQTRVQLLNIMKAHSPEYAAGNESWAGDAAMQDALESGRSFLNRPISDLQSEYSNLSAGERAQHNVGAVSGPLRDRLFNTSAVDRAKILTNPDIQERLQTVVPPSRMPVFLRNTGYEHQIALSNQAIPSGSDTFENAMNESDAGGVDGAKRASSVLGSLLIGSPRRALRQIYNGVAEPAINRYVRGINEQTANELAPRLSAGMTSRKDMQVMLDALATEFDQAARRRGSLPYAGTAIGTATGQLIARQK